MMLALITIAQILGTTDTAPITTLTDASENLRDMLHLLIAPKTTEQPPPSTDRERDHPRNTQNIPNEMTIGEKAHLSCDTGIKDAVGYEWTRADGQPVATGRKAKKGYYLSFHQVRERDTGMYICTTTTKTGQKYTSKYAVETISHTMKKIRKHRTTNEAGVITAFNCLQVGNRRAKLDLSDIKACRAVDTSAYHKPENTTIEILYRTTSIDVNVKRCELQLRVRSAACGRGFAGLLKYSHSLGFTTNDEYIHPLNQAQCEQAHKGRSIGLQLGTMSIYIHPEDRVTRTKIFMHGSALFQNQTCIGSMGPVFLGRDKEWTPVTSPTIVELTATLTVTTVKAVIDVKRSALIIPSLGFEENIQRKGAWARQIAQGIITMNFTEVMPEKECDLFKGVETGDSKYYRINRETAGAHKQYSDIVTTEIIGTNGDIETTLGLNLVEQASVCNRPCYQTQVKHIVLCKEKISHLKRLDNPSKLRELGGQATTHLQLHTSRTLSDIMLTMCESRGNRLLDIIRDFKTHGPRALFPDHAGGLKSVIRGEVAYIFDCKPELTYPISLENGTCCNNQPVLTAKEGEKPTIKFIEAGKKELVTSCNPVKCSQHLPVTFHNDNGTPLCQMEGKLKVCDEGQKLDPADDSPPAFKPLDKTEANPGMAANLMQEDLELINLETIAHTEFSNRIMGTVATNVVNCKDNRMCLGKASRVPTSWERELARLTMSNDQFILQHTGWGRVIVFAAYLWFTYCICTGFFTLLVRLRTRFTTNTERLTNCTCTGCLMATCSDMDSALNPLSQTKDRLNQRMWKQEERTSQMEQEDEMTKLELERINKVLELRKSEASETRREIEGLAESLGQLVLRHNYGIKSRR